MADVGNNIFLLETIVPCLTLYDPEQMRNTCPVCVCLRFPGLVDMEICEGDLCDVDRRLGGGEIRMTRGKSCLFTIGSSDLCRTAREFCATITVYRRVAGGPETRLVAQSKLEFNQKFTNVILEPDQPDRMRQLKQVLWLYESGRSKPVGTIEVIIRLTSHGDLLVTQFSRVPNTNKYQYKGLSEYVPTNAKISETCLDRYRCLRKCCKHSVTCRNKKQPKMGKDWDDCKKKMGRVNCVLTIMEMMKDLFIEVYSPQSTNKDNIKPNVTSKKEETCMFNPSCPISGCPFKIGEPITQFVDQLIKGKKPTKTTDPKNSNEIVDDADLFIVSVGRVDPCTINVPVHRNQSTQYLELDMPTECLPPPKAIKSSTKSKPKPVNKCNSKPKKKGGKNKK